MINFLFIWGEHSQHCLSPATMCTTARTPGSASGQSTQEKRAQGESVKCREWYRTRAYMEREIQQQIYEGWKQICYPLLLCFQLHLSASFLSFPQVLSHHCWGGRVVWASTSQSWRAAATLVLKKRCWILHHRASLVPLAKFWRRLFNHCFSMFRKWTKRGNDNFTVTTSACFQKKWSWVKSYGEIVHFHFAITC